MTNQGPETKNLELPPADQKPLLKSAALLPENQQIIKAKATERPFTNQYDNWDELGTYLCRQCGLALFRSHNKFHSGCGWPSFDAEIANTVKSIPDSDGIRTEIVCARCSAHLGHVFSGERFTARNIRHCVNSLSLDFVSDTQVLDTEEGIFAGGCFWGIEYLFKQLPSVIKTEVGYTGGKTMNPSYHDVCAGNTGHFEAIRVIYDSSKIDYTQITKYFLQIHNPEQINGQGPDMGEQYSSAIFYYDAMQKKIAEDLLQTLTTQGLSIATRVLPVSIFWPAEDYHQNYYAKNGKSPYCHSFVKRF